MYFHLYWSIVFIYSVVIFIFLPNCYLLYCCYSDTWHVIYSIIIIIFILIYYLNYCYSYPSKSLFGMLYPNYWTYFIYYIVVNSITCTLLFHLLFITRMLPAAFAEISTVKCFRHKICCFLLLWQCSQNYLFLLVIILFWCVTFFQRENVVELLEIILKIYKIKLLTILVEKTPTRLITNGIVIAPE